MAVRIIDNHDLSAHNTFGMKVSCARYLEYESVAELEALDFDSLPAPLLHVGGGSNLLFSGDFKGTVLHSAIRYIKYVDLGLDSVPVMVGAGVTFDDFVAQTCSHGLWGAENLSLIPGEVGGAAVQNIGAYGVEVCDIISGVVCYDLHKREKIKFSTAECHYGYRDSIFKRPENKGRYIVTGVLFRLSRKRKPRLEYKGVLEALGGVEPKTPQEVRDAIIRIRREKLPDPAVTGSAGSFFKNPVVAREVFDRISPDGSAPHFDLPGGMVKIPAAWLIDQCGLRGASHGGAAVHEKQPLVIINATGKASPEEVLTLEKKIISEVENKFGITLQPEVVHVS